MKTPDLAEIHRQFPAVAEYLSGIYILRMEVDGSVRATQKVAVVK